MFQLSMSILGMLGKIKTTIYNIWVATLVDGTHKIIVKIVIN